MFRSTNFRRATWLLLLVTVIVSGTSSVVAQNAALDPKDFESNSLLFVQQDVLPSFGQQVGVRLGTVRGLISGNITTNFYFTVPPPQTPPGGAFVADDKSLIIDPDGDQILFKVHSEGNATFDTLSFPDINPFRAPFLATYTATDATGKFLKYKNLVFPARGSGVISTLIVVGAVPGTPVGTVYVEVSRNAIRH